MSGPLLTPCQFDPGRGNSFQVIARRTARLGMFTLGKEIFPFFSSFAFTPLSLLPPPLFSFVPLFHLEGVSWKHVSHAVAEGWKV